MTFRVLGPTRALRGDGEAMALPRGRVRHLLATLLIIGEPVREGALRELLCDGGRTIGASTLRTHVAALRRALEPFGDRVRTDSATYCVEVYDGELDLHEFRDRAARGRAAAAHGDLDDAFDLLRKADRLCREPLLADLPDTPELSPLHTEIREERELVRETLVDVRLRLGHHRELVPELQAQVRRDPPRERTVEQLMLALYRSGRRSEACDTYHALRLQLGEAYGNDPTRTVRELYRRILSEESTEWGPALQEAVLVRR